MVARERRRDSADCLCSGHTRPYCWLKQYLLLLFLMMMRRRRRRMLQAGSQKTRWTHLGHADSCYHVAA
jgi:hypothetical protein